MKILFINPPTINIIGTNLPQALQEVEDPMPPLGLMYLAAYLEKNTNYDIAILDCPIEGLDYDQLEKRLEQEKPEVIGITTMTFTLLDVIKTVQIIKRINPKIKVILGGPHIHIYPEETIKIEGVDYLVLGEGERPLKDLLENLGNTEKLYEIKGIVFKDGGKIINTGPREAIKDLDELPFPARHLTPYKKYGSMIARGFPVTTMFTSRGCPYKCLFCDRPHLGKAFRGRSANNVVDEIEECQKMGIKEIFIYDDTFGVDRQRVLDICDEILKRKLEIAWDVRNRVNVVDEEILQKMKEAGCSRIHYGVEAGTQKILDVLRKGITLDQARKAFALTKKVSIQTLAYFMIGSPTETRKDILETIKFMKKLNPDYVHIGITTPFPATDLYRLGLEEKVLPCDYWKKFAENPSSDFVPFVWEKELSREELFYLLKKAYRSFYLRPSYVLKKIIQVKSTKELFAKARAGLNILKI
jgi:anaerobic magnesium-protoporphyrin IX monomethyl ester cyclase